MGATRGPRAIAVAALLAACAGDEPPPADLDDPIEGNRRVLELLCEREHACRWAYPPSDVSFEAIFGDTVADCVASGTPGEEVERAARDAVTSGRAVYVRARIDACGEALEATPCTELWTMLDDLGPTCTLFDGTVPDGGACTLEIECVSLRCSAETCLPR